MHRSKLFQSRDIQRLDSTHERAKKYSAKKADFSKSSLALVFLLSFAFISCNSGPTVIGLGDGGSGGNNNGGGGQGPVPELELLPLPQTTEGNDLIVTLELQGQYQAPNGSVTVSILPHGVNSVELSQSRPDFLSSTQRVLINPQTIVNTQGQDQVIVRFPTQDDSHYDGTEEFRVTLSNPSNAILGGTIEQNGILLDNEALPQISITNHSVVSSVDEGRTATFSIEQTIESEFSTTVLISPDFSQGSAQSADINLVRSQLTIPSFSRAGSSVGEIRHLEDGVFEGDENYYIEISTTSQRARINFNANRKEMEITENQGSLPVVYLSKTAGTMREGGNSDQFNIVTDQVSTSDITVDLELVQGPGTSNDFVTQPPMSGSPASVEITIPAGSSQTTVDITAVTDTVYERSENITLQINHPSANATINRNLDSIVYTITDTAPSVSFSATNVSVREGNQISFKIQTVGNVTSRFPMTGTLVPAASAHQSPKADWNLDYRLNSTQFTIPVGQTESLETFILSANADGSLESTEYYTLLFENLQGATAASSGSGGNARHDGEIIDVTINIQACDFDPSSLTISGSASAITSVGCSLSEVNASTNPIAISISQIAGPSISHPSLIQVAQGGRNGTASFSFPASNPDTSSSTHVFEFTFTLATGQNVSQSIAVTWDNGTIGGTDPTGTKNSGSISVE